MNKGIVIFLEIFLASGYIAANWNNYPVIKNSVSAILDPTLGVLLKMNVWFGFIVIMALTSLVLTLAQKYLSDQEKLREI
jgi:uncharacterized membrane protein (DUF106 family)